MTLLLRNLRIVRRGRPGSGFADCAHCGRAVEHRRAVMVARVGATKGVWWCDICADELKETISGKSS